MKRLKNIILFIICLQITIPFVIEGCLSIPVLVSHYFHHNNEHEKIDFLNFLTEHYSTNHHDEKHDEHDNLPFHKHCDCFQNQHLALNLESTKSKFRVFPVFKEPKKIAFKQNCFQSNVSINIWKPPKIS